MHRAAFAFLAVALGAHPVAAQDAGRGTVIGRVIDAGSGEPLAAARVELIEAHRDELTRADGRFVFPAVSPGQYTLAVERIGYRSQRDTVTVEIGRTSEIDVALRVAALQVEGIVVTGTIGVREGRDALSPTSVVSGAELDRKLDGTLAGTLEDQPGVSVSGIGPTTARPVIRGLGGDRIVLLEDGVRPGDLSSTSSDHAVAIEPLTAQRFEVVRGPMSLLYGSSALGGVVNVVREEIPTSLPEHAHGAAMAQGESVNRGGTLGGYVVAPVGRFAVRAEATARRSQDVRTPDGALENTDARTYNAGVGLGRSFGDHHFGAAYRYYDSQYGIPGGYVGGHPTGVDIEMRRHGVRGEGELHDVGMFTDVRLTGAYTDYTHFEFESNGSIGTAFAQDVVGFDVLARHGPRGPAREGAVGGHAQYRNIATGGSLRTPSTYDVSGALFIVEEFGLGQFRLQTGARYDWARYTPRDLDAFVMVDGERVPVRERTFGSVSGSAGVLWAPSDPLRVGVSVARAYRTPDFNELYSNGPHLAANSYDVGDPTLGEETGLGVDAFVRWSGERVRADVAVFRNQLDGYIFPSSRGRATVGRVGGRPLFQYTNEDARFAGVEGSLEVGVFERLVVEANGSLVHAEFTSDRAPIPVFEDNDTTFVPASPYPPLIPPANGRVGVRYETPDWFVGAGVRAAAEQDRTGDFETTTPGWTTGDLTAGVRILHGERMHALTLRVDNVTDASYRDHMSRIKEIMPEPGRNISLLYRLTF